MSVSAHKGGVAMTVPYLCVNNIVNTTVIVLFLIYALVKRDGRDSIAQSQFVHKTAIMVGGA